MNTWSSSIVCDTQGAPPMRTVFQMSQSIKDWFPRWLQVMQPSSQDGMGGYVVQFLCSTEQKLSLYELRNKEPLAGYAELWLCLVCYFWAGLHLREERIPCSYVVATLTCGYTDKIQNVTRNDSCLPMWQQQVLFSMTSQAWEAG